MMMVVRMGLWMLIMVWVSVSMSLVMVRVVFVAGGRAVVWTRVRGGSGGGG